MAAGLLPNNLGDNMQRFLTLDGIEYINVSYSTAAEYLEAHKGTIYAKRSDDTELYPITSSCDLLDGLMGKYDLYLRLSIGKPEVDTYEMFNFHIMGALR